jgi:hypothetical protein
VDDSVSPESRAEQDHHEVIALLTLLHGQNQLLRRRVGSGRDYSRHELERHGESMDRVIRKLIARLTPERNQPPATPASGDAPAATGPAAGRPAADGAG